VFTFTRAEERRRGHGETRGHDGGLAAPVPGKVLKVLVRPGDRVEPDQPLVVLESMKMEHTLRATCAGVVTRVLAEVGAWVDRGAPLVEVEGVPGQQPGD